MTKSNSRKTHDSNIYISHKDAKAIALWLYLILESGKYLLLNFSTRSIYIYLLEMWAAQFVMFLTGRFFATFAMNVGFQFTVELMPTCLRGQGIALANVMAMVSQMTSPFIVYSVN